MKRTRGPSDLAPCQLNPVTDSCSPGHPNSVQRAISYEGTLDLQVSIGTLDISSKSCGAGVPLAPGPRSLKPGNHPVGSQARGAPKVSVKYAHHFRRQFSCPGYSRHFKQKGKKPPLPPLNSTSTGPTKVPVCSPCPLQVWQGPLIWQNGHLRVVFEDNSSSGRFQAHPPQMIPVFFVALRHSFVSSRLPLLGSQANTIQHQTRAQPFAFSRRGGGLPFALR